LLLRFSFGVRTKYPYSSLSAAQAPLSVRSGSLKFSPFEAASPPAQIGSLLLPSHAYLVRLPDSPPGFFQFYCLPSKASQFLLIGTHEETLECDARAVNDRSLLTASCYVTAPGLTQSVLLLTDWQRPLFVGVPGAGKDDSCQPFSPTLNFPGWRIRREDLTFVCIIEDCSSYRESWIQFEGNSCIEDSSKYFSDRR